MSEFNGWYNLKSSAGLTDFEICKDAMAEIAELKEKLSDAKNNSEVMEHTVRRIQADAIELMTRNKIKELEATLTGDKHQDVRSTIKLNLLTIILDENEQLRKDNDT